ncbi:MAG: ABC transporter ATP-binding protein [Granulosicoccus sp.]
MRGQNVLDHIDFTVSGGEQLAIIGRSGCGKSTLLHLMAGLQKPSGGAVRIDSKTVVKPCAKWNMMFQKASLFPWMSVVENVSLGLVYSGIKARQARSMVYPLIEMLGLTDKVDVNVQNLSGGQQQRVALARSLATDPDALFLDEPFSALDTFSRSSLQQEVASICRDKGITLVLVTHDIDEAVLMADRVLVMAENPGRVAADFTVDLPWPRQSRQPELLDVRSQLMQQFETASTFAPTPAIVDGRKQSIVNAA